MAAVQANTNSGPPYETPTWMYGGVPTIIPDVPICAAYIVCYLIAAVTHKTIFLINMKKKGKKFVMSAMTFGFSTIRLITFSLRLAWAVHPSNAKLALASNVFLNAGIPIIYIINLVFAQRIIRAQHPRLGWHHSLSILGKITLALIVLTLCTLIYAGIQMAMTLDSNLHRIARDIQLYGTTFYCFIAFLPLPMVFVGLLLPRRVRTEKFGTGHFRIKVFVLVTSALLMTIRGVWGTTTTWLPAILKSTQSIPWYYSKPAFYTVQLLTELIIVYMFILVRIDRRFYTPDGLPRGSYLTLPIGGKEPLQPYPNMNDFPTVSTLHVYDDDELFDDKEALADTLRYSSTSLLLDSASGKWHLQQQSFEDIYSTTTLNGSSTRSMNSSHPHSSMGGSKAPSITPSTWNRGRYNKSKEMEDGQSSRGPSRGRASSRWSAPAREAEFASFKSEYLQPPNEKTTNLRWSSPAGTKPIREQMEEAEQMAADIEGRGTRSRHCSSIYAVPESPHHLANTPMLRMASTPMVSNVPPPPEEVELAAPARVEARISRRMSFEDIGSAM